MQKNKGIIIGSDHGGWEIKEIIKTFLEDLGYKYLDCGSFNTESVDYPDIGVKVAKTISSGEANKGILICGTGIGMSIVANKFPHVRAALCHNIYTAKMSRKHNNANILIMGGKVIGKNLATEMVQVWLETAFEGDRHIRRLEKIEEVEKINMLTTEKK